ncbi:MAG TPA: hypothetical protein VMC10_19045 [Stellaceae bacterium]|nr:hypothetical protein [Stellaceae bacterium]
MGDELDISWAGHSGAPHVYFALGCLLVFRVIIAALQNREELEVWFHLRRVVWTRRLRQAGL